MKKIKNFFKLWMEEYRELLNNSVFSASYWIGLLIGVLLLFPVYLIFSLIGTAVTCKGRLD